MAQDLDNRLPISKEGLLAAIETAINIIVQDEKTFAVEYLERLYQNIQSDNPGNYAKVTRKT